MISFPRIPAALGAALACTVPAHAVVPVEDIPSLFQEVKSYVHELQAYGTQLEQLKTEAQTLGYTVNQFNALVANPSLANAVGLLGRVGINDPLPVSPYAIQGLISGRGSLNGTLGGLSGLSSFAASANHIYTPSDGSWTSQQMIARANGIAGTQSIGQQIHSQIADHFTVMTALRQDMRAATTPAERESVMGQIQAEQAWTANANGQLQAAGLLLQAERDNREQRANEEVIESIDGQLSQLRAAGVMP
jgi:hypothetical protein